MKEYKVIDRHINSSTYWCVSWGARVPAPHLPSCRLPPSSWSTPSASGTVGAWVLAFCQVLCLFSLPRMTSGFPPCNGQLLCFRQALALLCIFPGLTLLRSPTCCPEPVPSKKPGRAFILASGQTASEKCNGNSCPHWQFLKQIINQVTK